LTACQFSPRASGINPEFVGCLARRGVVSRDKHLHALGAVWLWQLKHKQAEAEFLYHSRKFKVKGVSTFGFQDSPFGDGTRSGSDVTVHNLSNGKKLGYALLVPYMVERYGFYEGKGTSYRVDPRKVVEIFDFLKAKKKE
jgi:hypothetical protein